MTSRRNEPSTLVASCGLGRRLRRPVPRSPKVRQIEIAQQLAAVRVRVGAHPAITGRSQRAQIGTQRPVLVEQILRTVAAQPILQLLAVVGVGACLGKRDLVRAPGSLYLLAVHYFRARSSPWGCAG